MPGRPARRSARHVRRRPGGERQRRHYRRRSHRVVRLALGVLAEAKYGRSAGRAGDAQNWSIWSPAAQLRS